MIRFVPLAVVGAALFSAPSLAAPVAANPQSSASARIVRPLRLTGVRDLDLGTVTFGTLTSSENVGVNIAGNFRLCGTSGELTCSGAFHSALFNVQGTRNMQVRVRVDPVILTNMSSGGGETLTLIPGYAGLHTLTSSGAPGTNFTVGGTLTVEPTTVDGVYRGEIKVTVDYN